MSETTTRTENGPSQYCRGAVERGLPSHLATTYTTLHYSPTPSVPRERRFHFCDAHPIPADKVKP